MTLFFVAKGTLEARLKGESSVYSEVESQVSLDLCSPVQEYWDYLVTSHRVGFWVHVEL